MSTRVPFDNNTVTLPTMMCIKNHTSTWLRTKKKSHCVKNTMSTPRNLFILLLLTFGGYFLFYDPPTVQAGYNCTSRDMDDDTCYLYVYNMATRTPYGCTYEVWNSEPNCLTSKQKCKGVEYNCSQANSAGPGVDNKMYALVDEDEKEYAMVDMTYYAGNDNWECSYGKRCVDPRVPAPIVFGCGTNYCLWGSQECFDEKHCQKVDWYGCPPDTCKYGFDGKQFCSQCDY